MIKLQLPDKCKYYIPLKQLEITYSKSPGPGGQNVNKVNTKVDIRFKVSTATWLTNDMKQKISEKVLCRIIISHNQCSNVLV